MKQKEIQLYLDFAKRVSSMSHAVRLKVGAIIAKDNGNILSYGYNGMPTGMDNCCEFYVSDVRITDVGVHEHRHLQTNPEVLHAESNAIMKCAKEGKSTNGAWLFLTHSPCINCAKLIVQSGISAVVYLEDYRDSTGVDFLNKCGVNCTKF